MTQDTPSLPRIPTGQELYDALMGHIEPELTTEGSKNLAATYQNESPEDRAHRMSRYDLAFDRYEHAEQEYLETLQTQVGRYKKSAVASAEMTDRKRDENVLGSLLHAFQTA